LEIIISPTHKRTEGRAPVWGSEFTSKDAALQGGSSRKRCYAERKIVRSGDCVVVASYPLFSPNPLHGNYKPTRRYRSRVIRGCWFVLLYFAPWRPLPRPRRPLPPPLPQPAAWSNVS